MGRVCMDSPVCSSKDHPVITTTSTIITSTKLFVLLLFLTYNLHLVAAPAPTHSYLFTPILNASSYCCTYVYPLICSGSADSDLKVFFLLFSLLSLFERRTHY